MFSFLRLLPRVFCPVNTIDTSATFLPSAASIQIPLLCSPTGPSSHGHPNSKLNVTRALCVTGIPQIVSTMALVAFANLVAKRDSLSKAGKNKAKLWFQLYVMKDRKASKLRIRQVAEAGARAVVVTVDVAAIGNRAADVAAPPVKTGEAKAGRPAKTGVAAQGARLFDGEPWVALLQSTPLSLELTSPFQLGAANWRRDHRQRPARAPARRGRRDPVQPRRPPA